MKAKVIITIMASIAAIGAASVTAAYASVPKLSDEYTEFMDYCFDGSCKFYKYKTTFFDNNDSLSLPRSIWELEYNFDDRGYPEGRDEFSIKPYIGENKELYPSKKAMIDTYIFNMASEVIGRTAPSEFNEMIAEKYHDENGAIEDLWFTTTAESHLTYTDTEHRIIPQRIKAGSGYKYSDYDLKAIAQDPDFIFRFSASVPTGGDPEKSLAVYKQMKADFEEYTEAPMNYSFELIRYYEENGEVCMDVIDSSQYVMGEDTHGGSIITVLNEQFDDIYKTEK